MAHTHSIYDTDAHFKIDSATRLVKNVSETKTMLVQFDHNSERFTFEVPRIVDGHDLSTCNRVLVHYINIEKATRRENRGVYEVTDLQISDNDDQIVICSWLISSNATQYVGNLAFVVQFACVEGEDVVYSWNTAKHSNVTITDGVNNSDAVVEEYADVLQEWWEKLFTEQGGTLDENSRQPLGFWVGTTEELSSIPAEEIPNDRLHVLTDDPTLNALNEIPKLNSRIEELEERTDNLLIGVGYELVYSNSPDLSVDKTLNGGLYMLRVISKGTDVSLIFDTASERSSAFLVDIAGTGYSLSYVKRDYVGDVENQKVKLSAMRAYSENGEGQFSFMTALGVKIYARSFGYTNPVG